MLPTLSRLSVSIGPGSRLRHRCSSQYLRISPLHWEFRLPLSLSSPAVSSARPRLSPGISRLTDKAAYTPFTPSNSEQRSPPPYYRGCWHGVSRGLLLGYRLLSSPRKGVYTANGVILHAASLRQAFAHCARFLHAKPRRALDHVEVPVWPTILSDRLSVIALVGRYPTNELIDRRPLLLRPCGLSLPANKTGSGMRY